MCLCCAFLPPRFYRKFDLYLLRCGPKTQDMPVPREKTSSVLFSEYLNLEKVAPHFKHGPGRNRVSGGEGEN